MRERYDVVILGGGLAGQTLARQVKHARPDTSILIAERREHPVPEAAFKVGESTAELGSLYLRKVLRLEEHLEKDQLRKLGLRFFLSAGDNADISRRVEFGLNRFFPIATFQLDRGRLENYLARENIELGVEFLDGCKVQDISLSREGHSVVAVRGSEQIRVSGRWLIDASGRPGLLKRRLGLATPIRHDVNAAWFRVAERIAVDDWSSDPAWRARVPTGLRWLSTNHLMGRGYWVWLIPLSSGSTSIGVVADPALHPFERINSFERAMQWLAEHEPQCARMIRPERLQDFKVLRHYAHGCARVFSADRWCLTGECGVFLDPLYSVGTDFIALSNTFITDFICRDLAGEGGIEARIERAQRFYFMFFEFALMEFEGQYSIFGNARVTAAKSLWDTLSYLGSLALVFAHGKLCDWDFIDAVAPDLDRFQALNARVQRLFREWEDFDHRQQRPFGPADIPAFGSFERDLAALHAHHRDLLADLSEKALRLRIAENLRFCEGFATELFRRAAGLPGDAPVDPYTMSLRAAVPEGAATEAG